jgi:hypothetical protein
MSYQHAGFGRAVARRERGFRRASAVTAGLATFSVVTATGIALAARSATAATGTGTGRSTTQPDTGGQGSNGQGFPGSQGPQGFQGSQGGQGLQGGGGSPAATSGGS